MTQKKDSKALVAVLEDIETAHAMIDRLHSAGFPTDKLELVKRNVSVEAPEIQTPEASETNISLSINSSAKGAGYGAGLGVAAGVIAAVLTPFPGLGLGFIAASMLAGATAGGAAGAVGGTVKATGDDSVDLPKLKEYEQLVIDGHKLVVVLGTHEEVMRAEKIVNDIPDVVRHIHFLHGHEFHEHPARDKA